MLTMQHEKRQTPVFPLHSLLLVVFLSVVSVDASISIAETGQTFDSKPERYIGQRLWKGYEYMGRLQYLAENPTLCQPPSSSETSTTKYRINQPSDGLPGEFSSVAYPTKSCCLFFSSSFYAFLTCLQFKFSLFY